MPTVPPQSPPDHHARSLPEPATPQEAARVGLALAGPMPGQPAYTLVTCRGDEDDPLLVGTVGMGHREGDASGAEQSLAIMVYAGLLKGDERHGLGQAVARKGQLMMWQPAHASGELVPTWVFRWLGRTSLYVAARWALLCIHNALDGTVGDPDSPHHRLRMMAKVRRASTSLGRDQYVMACESPIDLRPTLRDLVPSMDEPETSPGTPAQSTPSGAQDRTDEDDRDDTSKPNPATCRIGSLEWLVATAAHMGLWDESDSTVNIRRPSGSGWYGAHVDESSARMLRRLPLGTFGFTAPDYLCYVTPASGRRKTFVIYSSAGTHDNRAAPVLEEICRKAPGRRVVRRPLPTPQRLLFGQADKLPPLTIHPEL